MDFPSMTRVAAADPKRFLGLIAFMGICSVVLVVLQETVPDSESARTGVILMMFLVGAVYVGSTHDTLTDQE